VLDLVQAVAAKETSTKIGCLWHNRPLDVVREREPERLAAVLRAHEDAERLVPARAKATASDHADGGNFGLVVKSVKQGDDLYAAAKSARISINCGFKTLVATATPGKGYARRKVGDLELTVIGPDQARIDALREKWRKETKHLEVQGLLTRSTPIAAAVAGETDDSVPNLSSIVFLARYGGRTMLMTGDARGDYIIDGLKRARLLHDGRAKLDILKLQHHGSARNADEEFFQTVLAETTT
jgi:hypothetical protein